MAYIKSPNIVFDYDAASMYPRVIDSLNTIKTNYYVMNTFPFDVVHKDELIKHVLQYDINVSKKPFESYDRRLDAEMHKLIALKQYHLESKDLINAQKVQKQLDNIKEDYPEWLI